MIKVMLTDDHAMLREGLRSKFEACPDIELIGEAGNAAELMAQLKNARPNVVVLDMKLPDANGITLMRQIKLLRPLCKVVILTMYDHVRYVLHALESGADGFVVKGAPFEELLKAVRAVSNNETFISSAMASKVASHLRRGKKTGALEQLSQREFEVLILLGSGLSIKEISFQLGVSEKTVTTYRARVMEKLQLANKADIIRYALEAGLIE